MKTAKAQQPAKKSKPIDLSEYEDQAVPFDSVIRKLAHVATKPKPEHKAKKRAK